ncbi:MAG TPA: hypothetical protein VLL76_03925 [Candidatus Omnitrophota bacterium]|nr:hypothetical protein [Candidatus Omnitrophota bacterium]
MTTVVEVEGGRLPPEHHLPAYNPVYERLVRGDDDLVGLVAYGLYKQSKRDWIKRYFDKHGASPSDDLLLDYVDRYSDADLNRFREQAEDMMLRFAEVMVEDRAPLIREEGLTAALSARLDAFGDLIRDNSGLKMNVAANILANLILGGVTLILVLGVYFAPDIPDIAKSIAQWVKGEGG